MYSVIVDGPANCYAGFVQESATLSPEELSEFWKTCSEDLRRIQTDTPEVFYGLRTAPPYVLAAKSGWYMAAVCMKPRMDVPGNATIKKLSDMKYVRYTYDGHISEFDDFVKNIWQELIPKLDWLVDPHGLCIERYDQRWDLASLQGVMDYYVPLEPM